MDQGFHSLCQLTGLINPVVFAAFWGFNPALVRWCGNPQ
jgi:hypothetical protein